ncbi:ribose 5-phosphate isomerase A, partial [Candidatus Micrarchaeota archaeon CG06_land_8_20_14_3_00_50_6]
EKLVEYNAKKFVIMVDEGKLETKDYKVPVEIVPFSREFVIGKLRELDLKGVVRETGGNECLTDNGNLIVDVEMKAGSEKSLPKLEKELVLIPGVVETGIFTKVDMVIVGKADGSSEQMA